MDSVDGPAKPSLASMVGRLIHRGRRKKHDRSPSGVYPVLPEPPRVQEFRVPNGIRILTLDNVRAYTDGFNDDNFLGQTESSISRVYRGRAVLDDDDDDDDDDQAMHVVVETWERKFHFFRDIWEAQIKLLTDPAICSHPNVAKLYGCFESRELLGLVYDCQAIGTLRTMILDESFNWRMRIRTALGVARVLNLLHSQRSPLLVRNLEPGSILLDKDFNPVVFGFGAATGGFLGDRSEFAHPCHIMSQRYTNPHVICFGGFLEPACDLYSYGALVLAMITKSHDTVKFAVPKDNMHNLPYDSSVKDLSPNFSFYDYTDYIVQCSFSSSEGYSSEDGTEMVALAVKCLKVLSPFGRVERPQMLEIVKCLEGILCRQMDVPLIQLENIPEETET